MNAKQEKIANLTDKAERDLKAAEVFTQGKRCRLSQRKYLLSLPTMCRKILEGIFSTQGFTRSQNTRYSVFMYTMLRF